MSASTCLHSAAAVMGKGAVKAVCARVCTNCTPSHVGRCENYGNAARTNTRDEDLVDNASGPDVVSDQPERLNSQLTLTLTRDGRRKHGKCASL